MFLNNDELVRLTGREQHAAQKRYLNRKKIPFEENVVWVTAPRVRISPSPPMTRLYSDSVHKQKHYACNAV